MKTVYWVLIGILLPATANASAPPAAVPEPASLVLLATGVAGLGIFAITRRRKK